jgi:hypothetical protein
MKNDGGMILTGENRKTRRKTCPIANLSTTNPTWIDPGANAGLYGERPATNRLSHGTAQRRNVLNLLTENERKKQKTLAKVVSDVKPSII